MLAILHKLDRIKTGQSSSFILHGERGIGKTSLAKLINHVSQAKDEKLLDLNFITSYCAVSEKRTFKVFWKYP